VYYEVCSCTVVVYEARNLSALPLFFSAPTPLPSTSRIPPPCSPTMHCTYIVYLLIVALFRMYFVLSLPMYIVVYRHDMTSIYRAHRSSTLGLYQGTPGESRGWSNQWMAYFSYVVAKSYGYATIRTTKYILLLLRTSRIIDSSSINVRSRGGGRKKLRPQALFIHDPGTSGFVWTALDSESVNSFCALK
jgi:hypothetical protein